MVFMTNDREVRRCRLFLPECNREVAFTEGILDPARYGEDAEQVEANLRARTTWPIYGVHFHDRDGREVVTSELEDESRPRIRHGAVGTAARRTRT